jgi:DNA-binding transcriptional ArsR family regulator
MKEMERTLKVLANRRRLAILKHLKSIKEASVADIAKEIQLSFKATSKHLGVLASRDILDRTQKSSQMFYALSQNQKPAVRSILTLI